MTALKDHSNPGQAGRVSRAGAVAGQEGAGGGQSSQAVEVVGGGGCAGADTTAVCRPHPTTTTPHTRRRWVARRHADCTSGWSIKMYGKHCCSFAKHSHRRVKKAKPAAVHKSGVGGG